MTAPTMSDAEVIEACERAVLEHMAEIARHIEEALSRFRAFGGAMTATSETIRRAFRVPLWVVYGPPAGSRVEVAAQRRIRTAQARVRRRAARRRKRQAQRST